MEAPCLLLRTSTSDLEGIVVATQTLQIQRRGPGRPKTRNTEVVTLNLDKEALKMLREMSIKYNMRLNHIIEALVLAASNDSYPIQVAEENSKLKERVKLLENEIVELKSELEKIRARCEAEKGDIELREIRRLKEDSHRILDKYEELKVFKLVMNLFNVQPGERLQYLTKKFVEDYFVAVSNKELISKELELKIIKNPETTYAGWIVRKLRDS